MADEGGAGRTKRPGSNFIQEDAIRARLDARMKRVDENLTVHKTMLGGTKVAFNDFLKRLADEKNQGILNRYIEDIAKTDATKVLEFVKKLATDGERSIAAALLGRFEPESLTQVRAAFALLGRAEKSKFVENVGDPHTAKPAVAAAAAPAPAPLPPKKPG